MVARARKAAMPAGVVDPYEPYVVDRPGRYLIISDLHIPVHDVKEIDKAVRHGRKAGIRGVILNGDTIDSHEMTRHEKDPRAPKYVREIELARKFLDYLRGEFPKAEIIWKNGNHDDWAERYIIEGAPALWGLPGMDLSTWLDMKAHGVDYVTDQRIIYLGKLSVLHGHEYKGGGGGRRPAEWLWKKALSPALCGHFHRSDEYDEKTIRGVPLAAWTTGCLCTLKPRWLRNNHWNHGYAVVELFKDGTFTVDNVRVRKGVAV